MKVSIVSRNKALIEMPVDELFRISESLDAVISQYEILDKQIIVYPKEVYQELHEELCEMVLKITDDKGNLIPS